MEITFETFSAVVQGYEQLKERAREVFDIRAVYFPYKGSVDTIDIFKDEVQIETSYYSCGSTETDWHCFPSHLLMATDEELHNYFNISKKEEDRKEQERAEAERLRAAAAVEKREREQLAKLMEKYY